MLKVIDKQKRHIGVEMQLTEITPDVAASWLEKNTKNRKVQKRYVTQFARDMESRSWRITGDAIRFDTDGILLDGQKRLMACVQAGVPFTSAVIWNLPPETRDVIDTGQTRSGTDLFAMRGVNNASAVASTYKLLINQRRGTSNVGGVGTVTHGELITAHKRHPSLPLYVVSPGRVPRGLSLPIISYVRYVGSTLLDKKAAADAMIDVMVSGTPAYDGCPMHALRERVIRNYETTLAVVRNRDALVWTTKHCWNLFARGEKASSRVWRSTDTDIEGLDLTAL